MFFCPFHDLKAVHILRIMNRSMLTFVLFDSLPAGSPDPGGLPDLECEERFGQWVLKPAFPGERTSYCSCTTCLDVEMQPFVHLCVFVLVQVCHIVLGLRPGTPEEEGQIIRYTPVLFICHVIVYSFEEYDVGPNKCYFCLCVCVCVGAG